MNELYLYMNEEMCPHCKGKLTRKKELPDTVNFIILECLCLQCEIRYHHVEYSGWFESPIPGTVTALLYLLEEKANDES
jgi:hypothetical protein